MNFCDWAFGEPWDGVTDARQMSVGAYRQESSGRVEIDDVTKISENP
jgi:hypothetical protein